jgi:tetratricopeptide (TPR) repeat protein
VSAALRDYLAAKLDLPPGSVPDAAPAALHASAPETAAQVAAFFDACQAARFAPGGTTRAELERLFALADGIVRACEKIRRLSALPVIVALALAGGALAADESPRALFFRGNALYSEDRHADAAAAYRGVLAAGVESGAVHFNLGNAYFKAGDVGRAVLAYERARRLIPGDPDLRANLAYAAETSGDAPEPSVLTTLAFPLAQRFDTETLAWLAAGGWWVTWLAACLARLVPAVGRLMRPIAVLGALGVALGASSGLFRWWTLDRPTFAVVLAEGDTPIRAEPSPTATTLFATKPGTVVTVSRSRDAWLQVVARDGRRGWMERARAETL